MPPRNRRDPRVDPPADELPLDEERDPADADREVYDGRDERGNERGGQRRDDLLEDAGEPTWEERARDFERDPHRGRPSARLKEIPGTPLASYPGDEAVAWEVKIQSDTGRAPTLGTIHINCSRLEFIRKFYDSMPEPGEEAVTFLLTPLDVKGNRVGVRPGDHYADIDMPPTNVDLQRVRASMRAARDAEEARSTAGRPAATDPLVEMLKEQLREAREARVRAEKDALEERKRLREEQRQLDEARRNDINLARVGPEEQYGKLMTTQAEIAAEERRRAAEAAKDERERREQERKDEQARWERKMAEERAEREGKAAAELARIQADNAIRLAEIESRARIEEARANERAAAAKLEIEKERLRLTEERAERDRRDKIDRDERHARDREEQARRDAHELAMEKIRTDALTNEKERMKDERQRQDQYLTLLASTLKDQRRTDDVPKVSFLDQALAVAGTLGIDMKTFLPGMLERLSGGGAAGIGTVIAEGLLKIGNTLAEKLGDAEGGEEEEEDEEEEGDEPEEEAEEPAPAPAPKQLTGTPKIPDFLLPGPTEKEKEPVAAVPAVQPVAAPVPPAPAAPLPELKAGREAVQALWVAVRDVPRDGWRAIVEKHVSAVTFLQKYGYGTQIKACVADGYFQAELAKVLEEMGNIVARGEG